MNSAVFPLGEGPCRSHRSGATGNVRCLFFRRAARAACDCRLRALVPSAGLPSRPCNANAGCDCTLQQAIPSVEAARYPSGSSGIWGEAAAQRNRILHSCGAISSEPQNARRNCSRSLAFADERHRLQLQHTIAACVGRALGQWCRCSLWIDQNGLPCGFASRMQHAAASPQAIAPSLTARRRYAGCYERKCKLGRGRTQERDRERTREHKPCNPACGAIGLHAQRAARLRRAGLQGA